MIFREAGWRKSASEEAANPGNRDILATVDDFERLRAYREDDRHALLGGSNL